MKIKNTIIGMLILSFILSFGAVAPVSASSDFSGEDNSKTLQFLYALGVLDPSDSIELSQTMTRAQFAMYVTRMMNVPKDECYSNDIMFSDVTEDNQYTGYINYVASKGWMSGYSSRRFAPDVEVTYQECIKVMLDLMGYTNIAQSAGGYPNGYLSTAMDIKLRLNGKNGADTLTNEEMTKLIEKALDIDIIKVKSIGVQNTYAAQKDCTLLNEYFDTYKDKGVVNAVRNAALDGYIDLGKKECLIGTYIYNIGDSNVEDYLGYNVDYYYKEIKGGDNTLVTVIPRDDNKLVQISKDDIRPSSDYTKVSYDIEGKIKDIKLGAGAYVLYNGRALAAADKTIDRLQFISAAGEAPLEGALNIIDNNGDGTYDVLDIRAGRVVVVDRVDTLNKVIYDKLNPTSFIDADTDSADFDRMSIMKEGTAIEASQINEWDVLVVEDSYYDNDKIRMIKVSSSSVSGKTGYVDKTENKITIGDKTYSISQSYLYAKANGTQTFGIFDVFGTDGVFYLDIYGNVVASSVGATSGGYGFLLDYTPVEEGDDLGALKYRILATDGTISKIIGEEKVRIITLDNDGHQIRKKYKGLNDISLVLPKNKLIKFERTEEGVITEITVPSFFSAKTGYKYNDIVKAKNSGAFVATEKASLNYTDDCVRTFESKIYVDDRTKLLLASGEMKSEDDFSWLTINYMSNAKSYEVEAYEVDEFMYAPIVVLYQTTTMSNIDSTVSCADFLLVSKSAEIVDDKGDVVTQITGVQEGQEKVLTIKDTSKLYDLRANKLAADKNNPVAFTELNRGDVIQYYESGYNTIGEALRIFKSAEKDVYTNAISVPHQEKVLIYGQVTKIDKSNRLLVVNINPPGSTEQNLWVLDMRYTSFSLWDDKVVKGAGFDDIKVGDFVFVRDQWSRIHNTAIMRFED